MVLMAGLLFLLDGKMPCVLPGFRNGPWKTFDHSRCRLCELLLEAMLPLKLLLNPLKVVPVLRILLSSMMQPNNPIAKYGTNL